jgi:hypothetical protein
MLVSNTTSVLFGVDVNLKFDDGSTKECIVEEGDYLLLYFNYNGNKLRRACRVVDIKVAMYNTSPVSYSSTLTLDCSSTYGAERLKVSAADILNIRLVTKEYCESLAPHYNITDTMINQPNMELTEDTVFKTAGVGVAAVGLASVTA